MLQNLFWKNASDSVPKKASVFYSSELQTIIAAESLLKQPCLIGVKKFKQIHIMMNTFR